MDEQQIRNECRIIKSKGLRDVAIVGVFSPLDVDGLQEVRARKIILEEIPDADIVLSSEGKYGQSPDEPQLISLQSVSWDILKEKMPPF